MRLLVLGGSVFLGRTVVEESLSRGDEVTTLTRGLSGSVPLGVRALVGDRLLSDGLMALGQEEWDVVVDVCRQSPTQVGRSVAALRGRVGRYVYVSSVSVYASFAEGPLTEESPVVPAAPVGADEEEMSEYGPLKVRCEKLVRDGFGEDALIVRPGLIVGPGDPSDRFTYWVERGARGGVMLAPGDPGARVRFVDVRDLAKWIVHAEVSGTYNAVGPAERMTMGEVISLCQEVGGGDAQVEWVHDQFLLDNGVVPYAEMPLWVPALRSHWYFSEVGIDRAVGMGLTFRSVRETVEATLSWTRSRDGAKRQAGPSAQREAQLLELWRQRKPTED
jgi:2'-hydroxyisoflavone reductase